MIDSPRARKKNQTKVLFRGIRHDCSICRKIPFNVSLRTPLLWNVANRSHQLDVINNKPFSTTSTSTFIKLVKAVQTSHQLLLYKDLKYKQYSDKIINKEIRIAHLPKIFSNQFGTIEQGKNLRYRVVKVIRENTSIKIYQLITGEN